jgi:site-specific recombinase XerD
MGLSTSIYERSGRYYLNLYDPDRDPNRKQLSLRTSDEREATRRMLDLEDALDAGMWHPWEGDTVGDYFKSEKTKDLGCSKALERFLATKKAEDCSPNTLRTYRGVLDLFLRRQKLRDAAVSAVSRSDCEAFIRQGDLARATQRKRYRFLRAYFNWLHAEGYLDASPLDSIKPPKEGRRMLDKAATAEDVEKICEKAPRRWALQWRWMFYTGMRSSEVARLKWEHVDRRRGVVKLYRQKSGQEGVVPLSSKAEVILDEIGASNGYVFNVEARPVRTFVSRSSRHFKKHREAAGLRDALTQHGLRHGFCSHLAAAGKSAFFIKEAARHADVSTSARYVRLHKDTLRDGLNEAF